MNSAHLPQAFGISAPQWVMGLKIHDISVPAIVGAVLSRKNEMSFLKIKLDRLRKLFYLSGFGKWWLAPHYRDLPPDR